MITVKSFTIHILIKNFLAVFKAENGLHIFIHPKVVGSDPNRRTEDDSKNLGFFHVFGTFFQPLHFFGYSKNYQDQTILIHSIHVFGTFSILIHQYPYTCLIEYKKIF